MLVRAAEQPLEGDAMGGGRRGVWLGLLLALILGSAGCGADLDLDASEVGAPQPGVTHDRTGQPLWDELRAIGERNVGENLDFEVQEWCEFRSILDGEVPPGSVWDADDPRDQQRQSEVLDLVELLARSVEGPLITTPDTFATRICERCAGFAEPLPAGSPRLPPDSPGVWAPDCDLTGVDDVMGELGCAALLAPDECEAAEACWYRYLGDTGCYDLPDLVSWTEQWCAHRRQMAAWNAEREAIRDWDTREAWLAANEPLFDRWWEEQRELDAAHDGFDPAGTYVQPLKCALCPDVYDDC